MHRILSQQLKKYHKVHEKIIEITLLSVSPGGSTHVADGSSETTQKWVSRLCTTWRL